MDLQRFDGALRVLQLAAFADASVLAEPFKVSDHRRLGGGVLLLASDAFSVLEILELVRRDRFGLVDHGVTEIRVALVDCDVAVLTGAGEKPGLIHPAGIMTSR